MRLLSLFFVALSALTIVFQSSSSLAGAQKTHSWFFKIGKVNCPAIAYYTSMSTSSSTSSDSCENVTWIVKNQKEEQKHFVTSNYALLEEQVSQGHGELIADYATLMNCSGAPEEFGQALRSNFDKAFSTDRSEDKLLEESESIIRSQPELAKKCVAGA